LSSLRFLTSWRAGAILKNAELSGGGLSDHTEDQHPHVSFGLLVIVMQDAAGSLFDDLDTTLQSGSS
jgi:hypothetical protein